MDEKEKVRNWWSIAEGVIWFILMIGMLCFVLTACSGNNSNSKGYGYATTGQETTSVSNEEAYDWKHIHQELTMPSKRPNQSMFMVIERNDHFTVFCHKETSVCYIYRYEGGITPMYNADGTLYTYRRY